MTAIAQAVSAALLDFVWQGLLAAFLLWTALFVLKNRSARARYLASSVALAAMAMLPVVTACLVYTAPAASQAPPPGPIASRVGRCLYGRSAPCSSPCAWYGRPARYPRSGGNRSPLKPRCSRSSPASGSACIWRARCAC